MNWVARPVYENIPETDGHTRLHATNERNVLFNDALNTFHLRLYGITTWNERRKYFEGSVLFNDALNTFYLRLYGVTTWNERRKYFEGNVLFNDALNTFHLWFYSVGVRCSSVVRTFAHVRWVVGSILHGVNPLSYFSFQPVLHDWYNKGCDMCYPV